MGSLGRQSVCFERPEIPPNSAHDISLPPSSSRFTSKAVIGAEATTIETVRHLGARTSSPRLSIKHYVNFFGCDIACRKAYQVDLAIEMSTR